MYRHMKTITIHVSEPVYREFKNLAQQQDRSTAELIRESMDLYLEKKAPPRKSLLDLKPVSLGKPKRKIFSSDSDLLDEMLRDLRS